MTLTSFQQADSYLNHPMFRMAMASLQKGEWEEGLSQLDKLFQAYPLEGELRGLRAEMQLRARIDEYEKKENSLARRRKLKTLAIRLGTVVLLALLAVFVATSYSRVINVQLAAARTSVEYQRRTMELAFQFRDAQDYLRAGQTETALAMLNEIAAINPNYPDLAPVLERAQRQQELDARYNQAQQLAENKDLEGALALFREIEEQEPFFRDVKSQILEIEKRTTLGAMLAGADQAFDDSNWADAAARYEELYLYNPDFQTTYVEDRLFTSYVNAATLNQYGSESLEAIQAAEEYYRKALALRPQDPATMARQEQVRSQVEERLFYGYIKLAQNALVEQPDSLEALNLANQYFAEALRIRPNDPELVRQAELAYKFVESLGYSSTGNWPAAIEALEYIYSQDTGYAGGTARQALYEARVARGDEGMAIGDFESALTDFQRAAVLAQDDPASKLRLYEIQYKLAEVMGLLGDYAEAVRLYGVAIDFAGLEERAQANSADMAEALAAARSAAEGGDYREAYRNYVQAVTWSAQAFDVVEHVVASGEYLSSIALDYNSTIGLIARANNLANPNLIITGQTLLIPILP